jgi:hypothetical protein
MLQPAAEVGSLYICPAAPVPSYGLALAHSHAPAVTGLPVALLAQQKR